MVFWIPFGIICFSYLIISIFIIRTFRKSFAAQDRAKLVRGLKRKAFIISASLVLCYIICWAPYNILTLMKFDHLVNGSWLNILYNLIVLNSVINPLIYGALDFSKLLKLFSSNDEEII